LGLKERDKDGSGAVFQFGECRKDIDLVFLSYLIISYFFKSGISFFSSLIFSTAFSIFSGENAFSFIF